MDENEKQARRRFFHKEPVLIPASDCYDFVVYPNGLMASFKGQRSAGNEKILLYFLTRHMSQETPEGETTEFKDVAQAFWGKHEYIAERTGLTPNRISDAIRSLVECGILMHEVKRGKGQHIAFTEAAIEAWVEYSRVQQLARMARSSGKRKQAVPVNGSGQFRLTEVGSSAERKQAVPVSGSGSYIEDPGIGFRESDPGTDQVDGCRKEQHPANGEDLVDIVQEVEPLFANPRNGYVSYAKLNAAFAKIPPNLRASFAAYLKLCWEENLRSSMDLRPGTYRLSARKLPTYLGWWQEELATAQSSSCH